MGSKAAAASAVRQRAYAARRQYIRRAGPPAGELKAIDVSSPNAQVTSAGTLTLLNGCARGDDIGERDGRQISMRSLEVRMEAQPIGTATSCHALRVLIFVDKQANAAAPTPAQVLAVVGSAEATVSAYNLEYRNRFWILHDRTFGFGAESGGAATGFDKLYIAKVWRYLNQKVTYNAGVAGTVADIATNSLYLLAIADTATAAQEPFLQFYSRLRFSDD